MRRLALIALFLVTAAGGFAVAAGADDTHSYRVELDNAFGIVEGSQVRVAGVNVGSVTGLEITPEKRAEVAIEVSGDLARLGTETRCSSEPQSLIAEYFIDCQPAGPPLEDGGLIPVEQTTQTVQLDVVQATFREPLRRRLQLFLNEFGTALAGNAENLNAAIRRGAPALGEFDRALAALADRNTVIRDMVGDSDQVLGALAERREEISRFIREARDVAVGAAERRDDLGRDVELLDDLLVELRPTLAELDRISRAGTPLVASLQRSASELTRLGQVFPGFGDAATVALRSLGDAGAVGSRAAAKAGEEVRLVRETAKKLPGATEPLKDLLRDIDDPRRVVEINELAARSCDDRSLPCWATGRKGPTGYTGMEGLFNYAYYLAGATNQVDQIGHLLHVNIYSVGDVGNPCGGTWWSGGKPGTADFGVPAEGGGLTTNFLDAHSCVSWLGPNQPRINEPMEFPPYDPSVCPGGSAAPELCDPLAIARADAPERAKRQSGSAAADRGDGTAGGGGDGPAPAPLPGAPGVPPGVLDDILGDLPGPLGDGLGGLGAGKGKGGKNGGADPEAVESLLDFLFGGEA